MAVVQFPETALKIRDEYADASKNERISRYVVEPRHLGSFAVVGLVVFGVFLSHHILTKFPCLKGSSV